MKTVIGTTIASGLVCLAAMGTHIVVCLKSATYGLLIAGAIMPPIGIIHGIGHWFGAW